MTTGLENKQLTVREILSSQNVEFSRVSLMNFDFSEQTRDVAIYERLPRLRGKFLDFREKSFDSTLKSFTRKFSPVRVLDIGCGAGYGVSDLAKIPGVEAFGITARDFRTNSQRPADVTFVGRFPSPIDGKLEYRYESPDRKSIYMSNRDLQVDISIDDSHYFVADIHRMLSVLPADFFHLAVSYQACRYLFDPLRVLKLTYRSLRKGGYCFLESFRPRIYDMDGQNVLSKEQINELLTQSGLEVTYGKYDSGIGNRTGLALKKTAKRFSLPVRYHDIYANDDLGLEDMRFVSYRLLR